VNRLKDVFYSVLDEREQEIMLYRYSLFGRDELTQKELAERLGISRSYVSRIEKRALQKLRNALDN
jgi:RNA polymerase sporulation-specific sigma factor